MKKLGFLSTIILVGLSNSGNFTAYLFQFMCARVLDPVDFGIFNALNSFLVFLSAPLPVIGLVVTKITIKVFYEQKDCLKKFLLYLLKWGGWVALGSLCIGLFGIRFVKEYFHLSSPFPVVLISIQYGFGLLLPITLGIIQGLRYYLQYTFFLALGLWLRFLVGLVWVVFYKFTVNYALGCGVIGYGIAFFGTLIFLFKVCIRPVGEEGLHLNFKRIIITEAKKTVLPIALTSFAISGSLNLDISFVRHYIPGPEAGLYSVGAILGRVAFFLPGILMSIIFAESLHEKQGNSIKKLIFLTAFLSGIYCLVCWLAPGLLIELLMGKKYRGAGHYLKVISLAMTIFSVGNAILTYEMARENYGYLYGLIGGFLIAIFLIKVRFHSTPMDIAIGFLIGCSVATLAIMLSAIIKMRSR